MYIFYVDDFMIPINEAKSLSLHLYKNEGGARRCSQKKRARM